MPLIIVAGGIALLLVLIYWKVKPLYALLIISLAVGLGEGLPFDQTMLSIGNGIWSTLQSMLMVLCLGAMFGKIIEVSGAANRITASLIEWFGQRYVQWAVMLTGLLVGIPLFYNAGFVILIPLVFSIARNANLSLLMVGIPMAASLSVTHGFLPPHPGPTAIAAVFHADIGLTMLYGLVLSVPAVILAGPVFSYSLKHISIDLKSTSETSIVSLEMPGRAVSFFIALLPVALIAAATLLKSISPSNEMIQWLYGFSNPSLALSVSLLLAIILFQSGQKNKLRQVFIWLWTAVKDIFMIILIIAAGGGFKQVLVDSAVGEYIKLITSDWNYSPLLVGWLVAALLRISLGSATVAALTTAGIVLPLIGNGVSAELMVLAVGSGSLMFSHVNDTGFWMFKEYFNLSLGQTFRSWSLMETIVSVTGLAGVLLLDHWI